MFAYTLLAHRNDSDDDAKALAALVRDFAARFGVRPRLSLIPFNEIEPAYKEPEPAASPQAESIAGHGLGGQPKHLARSLRLERFRDVLAEQGVGGTLRYSGGGDVRAACGQLATAARGKRATLDLAPRTR